MLHAHTRPIATPWGHTRRHTLRTFDTHVHAHRRVGGTNTLLHQASGPSLPGISHCVVLGTVAGAFLQQRWNTAAVGPQRAVKKKEGECSSAGAACRLVIPASSHILSHQIKERQVTEDGSRAVVPLFRQTESNSFFWVFFLIQWWLGVSCGVNRRRRVAADNQRPNACTPLRGMCVLCSSTRMKSVECVLQLRLFCSIMWGSSSRDTPTKHDNLILAQPNSCSV